MLNIRTIPNATKNTYIMLLEKNEPKNDFAAAINWLDLKMFEYATKCENRHYPKSKQGIADFAEIMGALKFMHMARIINDDQCDSMLAHMKARY